MTVLGIPASLTNTTYTAPSGTFTLPTAKTACHGAVTVDLSACQLVDGNGTSGLLNAAADCTSLTVIGAGAPAGTGRGPTAPSTWTYLTTSGSTSPFIALTDTAVISVTLTNLTLNGAFTVTTGKGVDPTSTVTGRGLYCTGLAVGIEGYHSIDLDNCALLGGGANANPIGLHVYQFQGASPPSTRTLWVSGLHLRATNSTITGYVSNAGGGFLQGDSILVESDCESFYIDNCDLGHNSDSGGLDAKANWGQISNCTIYSDGGRGISGHTMGNGTGPWNGVRSINNKIIVNSAVLADSTKTEAFQAEGVLESFSDIVTLPQGARLATTSFDDAPGSGAPGSYPRLGNIALHSPRSPAGVLLNGPLVKGDDATHKTTLTVDGPSGVVPVIRTLRVGTFTAPVTGNPGMLFGASHGDQGINETMTDLAPAIVRCFEQSPSSWSATGQAKDVPAGVPIYISFTGNIPVMADTTAAGYTTLVNNLKNTLGGMPAIKGNVATWKHEPVGSGGSGTDGNYTIAQWQQSQINFYNDVIVPVNKNRSAAAPIRHSNPMNGFILANNSGGYVSSIADQWYISSVLAVYDFIGFDCYGYSKGAAFDQFALAQRYAASKGMPLAVPEVGYLVGGVPSDTTDAQELSVMQTVWNDIQNGGATKQTAIVCWFNGNSTNIAGKPNAKAYWKDLCQNQSIQPS